MSLIAPHERERRRRELEARVQDPRLQALAGGRLIFLTREPRHLESMRGAAVVATTFPACCLGLLIPAAPLRHSSVTSRAFPLRRHGNAGRTMGLSVGGDPSHETASTAVGKSTALSRAREVLFEPAFRNSLAPMAAAGALLGPNLDNYHSAFGVLTYKDPIELSLAGQLLVTTDWW